MWTFGPEKSVPASASRRLVFVSECLLQSCCTAPIPGLARFLLQVRGAFTTKLKAFGMTTGFRWHDKCSFYQSFVFMF